MIVLSEGTRLNKYISEAGVASRRAADRLIEEGKVTINGKPAVVGDRVYEDDIVAVNGKRIERRRKRTSSWCSTSPRG